MRTLLLTSLLAFSFEFSHATEDMAFKQISPRLASVDVLSNNPVACDNIVQAMLNYQRVRANADQAEMSDFYDTVRYLNSLYSSVSRYEGQRVHIPYGYYSSISQSAETAANNTRSFANTKTALSNRLSEILAVLGTCVP